MSDPEPRKEEEEAPLTGSTGDAAAPMRLRAEAPRVTRLSRKVLAGIGLVASVGIGGALIYALQTRDGGRPTEELYSTDNRSTADGLAGLPRDYSGVPQLGPPLPGDLGRPILGAQNRGQPLPNQPNPGLSAEEQRRLQEIETARVSRLFSGTENRPTASTGSGAATIAPPPAPDLAGLGLAPPPATPSAQDRQLAFLNAAADRRTDPIQSAARPSLQFQRPDDVKLGRTVVFAADPRGHP